MAGGNALCFFRVFAILKFGLFYFGYLLSARKKARLPITVFLYSTDQDFNQTKSNLHNKYALFLLQNTPFSVHTVLSRFKVWAILYIPVLVYSLEDFLPLMARIN